MLTQDQIDKLQPLTQHPKFGQLLKDAIEIWKEVNPRTCSFGIREKCGIIISDAPCCLIGASLVKKTSIPFGWVETSQKYFNLSEEEVNGLVSGFDNSSSGEDTYHDCYDRNAWYFGRNVGKIVLC